MNMKYFKLEELVRSDKARALGIDNSPDEVVKNRLELLVREVLDPARAILGRPIVVNSGYRSRRLNKAVGGAENSQHVLGEAADITCYNNWYLFELIQNNLIFDQLIYETKDIIKNGVKVGVSEWVHVSYAYNKNRNMAFKMHNGKRV